jgi:putative PIN family toxin of toxin-antitoxin system
MIRVVLDTSVPVSAVISAQGPNAQLFDSIAADQIMPCVSDVPIGEYHRVFSYRHLQHLNANRITKLRGLLEAASISVQPRHRLEISGRDDDNPVYSYQPCSQVLPATGRAAGRPLTIVDLSRLAPQC